MQINRTARRAVLAPALGLVLVTAVSACSSGSSSSSSATPTASAAPSTAATSAAASPAASGGSGDAVSEITTNWTKFFDPSTPNSERVKLLENGSKFASAISSLTTNPLASGIGSKVDAVKVTSATKAAVTYDITLAGSAVASNQTGTSVLQDGVWKVGDSAFCGLLTQAGAALNEKVPSVCSSVS